MSLSPPAECSRHEVQQQRTPGHRLLNVWRMAQSDDWCQGMLLVGVASPNWTISRSHSAFNIIRTSRNSYCMCICLLLHGRLRMAMNDEWELYATNSKSKSDVNESVNPSDFRFVYYCGTPTTFELQFELRNIPTVEQMQYTPWVNKKNKTLKSCP